MTDKTFTFSKDLWDLLDSNSIVYSSPLQGQNLQISDWQDVPTLLKTAIITQAAYYGFEED